MARKPQQQSPQGPQGIDPDQLRVDAVVITAWTENDPHPVQALITRQSWNQFLERIEADAGLLPERTYEFENFPSPGGRKTRYFMTGVVKFSGNYHSGIIPAKGG